jgi:hypothetical protein
MGFFYGTDIIKKFFSLTNLKSSVQRYCTAFKV